MHIKLSILPNSQPSNQQTSACPFPPSPIPSLSADSQPIHSLDFCPPSQESLPPSQIFLLCSSFLSQNLALSMMPLFSFSFLSPIRFSSSSVLVPFTVSDPSFRLLENQENLLLYTRFHICLLQMSTTFLTVHLWACCFLMQRENVTNDEMAKVRNAKSVINLSQEMKLARSDATHFGYRSIVLPTITTIRLAAVVVNAWRYVSLGDGRSLCLECLESAIMDTHDCQALYHAVRDYYKGMNMRIDQQLPILPVENQAFNEATERVKRAFDEAIEGDKHGFHQMPEITGQCRSRDRPITRILKMPGIEHRPLVGIRKGPLITEANSEVLLTGSVLAHELMHGWLHLKGYPNLEPEIEEGICQVLSYMWPESEVTSRSRNTTSTSAASSSSSWSSSKKGGKSSVENKLGEYFMYQITNDASPDYGGGFRAAMAAVNKYGLYHTLEHIRLMGTFPL